MLESVEQATQGRERNRHVVEASVVALEMGELLLQAIREEMAVDRRKALLWNGITTLAENKVRLLAGVPGSPGRKAWPVRISEFGKVRPIGLDDLRQLVIRRSEG